MGIAIKEMMEVLFRFGWAEQVSCRTLFVEHIDCALEMLEVLCRFRGWCQQVSCTTLFVAHLEQLDCAFVDCQSTL